MLSARYCTFDVANLCRSTLSMPVVCVWIMYDTIRFELKVDAGFFVWYIPVCLIVSNLTDFCLKSV